MKRAGLSIALCVVVALPGAPALAKKKHKKVPKLGGVVTLSVTGNTATTNGAESTATAVCPAGKQAVGGGFRAPLINNSALVVHSSYRSAANAWTVDGQVADGSGAVTAEVYCRNASAGPVTDVAASEMLTTTGEIRTLAPACPAGTRLVGGGFQSTVPPAGDAVVFPQVNQATSPTTWTVAGVENQDGAITLTAHAYCMAKIRPPAFLSQTGSGDGATFAEASAITPACPTPKKPKKGKKGKKGKKRKPPPKKLLSGGGFSAAPVNGAPGAPVLVIGASRTNGIGWLASAVNAVESPGSFSVTSQAICL